MVCPQYSHGLNVFEGVRQDCAPSGDVVARIEASAAEPLRWFQCCYFAVRQRDDNSRGNDFGRGRCDSARCVNDDDFGPWA
jgi:hypothetical protein